MVERRVLFIGDEVGGGRVRAALSGSGYRVETVGNAEDALLRFADGDGWGAVMLEGRVGGVSGLAVLGWLRERNPRVPVLFLAAGGSARLAGRALAAGARAFCAVPAGPGELARVIECVAGAAPTSEILTET
jgi:DNA-binding NtrC family response regulator